MEDPKTQIISQDCGNRTFDHALFYMTSELIYTQHMRELDQKEFITLMEDRLYEHHNCIRSRLEDQAAFHEVRNSYEELLDVTSKLERDLAECQLFLQQ